MEENLIQEICQCVFLEFLTSFLVFLILLTFQRPQEVDFCVLCRDFTCNQWEREAFVSLRHLGWIPQVLHPPFKKQTVACYLFGACFLFLLNSRH